MDHGASYGPLGKTVQQLKGEQDVDALIGALRHAEQTVRFRAVRALDEIGDASAVEGLARVAANDGDAEVRAAAGQAVAHIGEPGAATAGSAGDGATASEREKQELALLRLRDLHTRIAEAQAKGGSWLVPLLAGFGIAFGVLFVGTVILGLVTSALGPPANAPGVVGPLGLIIILAALAAWPGSAWLLRKKRQQRVPGLIAGMQEDLNKASEETAQQLPAYVQSIGGPSALADRRRVTDALVVLQRQHQSATPSIGTAPPGYASSPAASPRRDLFRRREPAAVYPLGAVTLGIYFFVWVYKIHTEVQEAVGPQRTTSPELALGLLFVPLFNFVWSVIVLYKVVVTVNGMLLEQGHTPKVKADGVLVILIIGQVANLVSLGIVYAAIVAIPLLWVGFAQVQRALNQAWESQGLV